MLGFQVSRSPRRAALRGTEPEPERGSSGSFPVSLPMLRRKNLPPRRLLLKREPAPFTHAVFLIVISPPSPPPPSIRTADIYGSEYGRSYKLHVEMNQISRARPLALAVCAEMRPPPSRSPFADRSIYARPRFPVKTNVVFNVVG